MKRYLGVLLALALFFTSGCAAALIGGAAGGGYAVATDERQTSRMVDDSTITTRINKAMVKDDLVKAHQVDVDTVGGDVTLTGVVKTRQESRRAVQIARQEAGVKSVRDNLQIGEKTWGESFNDKWLVSKIKSNSLKTPQRHPLDWKNPDFYNEQSLFKELERVFDICHGCRRCFNLCQAFPTLFDAVDESETMELDGVPKKVFWDVVDHCYLCDICFMTKCPYVPPHEWNLDFPHLMLRAKAVNFKKGETKFRDKFLTATDRNGKLFSLPLVAQLVNTANKIGFARRMLERVLGIHAEAELPAYQSDTLEKRAARRPKVDLSPEPTESTTGKVALFGTCYGNYNEPGPGEDLMTVFEHNGIPVILARDVQCCGMPKLELGDLAAIQGARDANIPVLAGLVDEGFDLTALVPSCVLMFKQELPLFFPDDPQVLKVRDAFFDPFEYLALRHKENKLKADFKTSLGKVAYHAACHQRVQNFGLKTRDILQLVMDTQVETIERCSGHDGTYAVKKEFFDASMKIVRPVAGRVKKAEPDHYGSDCPMAGHHVAQGIGDGSDAEHPITLLRKAYGI